MNPIKLSKQLQDTLISYLTTTFDVNRDGKEPALAKFIKDSFSRPRALFAGPYLELTAPYKTGESLEELAQAQVVSSKLLDMECFRQGRPLPINAPLYTHQAHALRKLCAEDRNIVVSSGTGSGKTECFLLPILNDLLIDPSPGVRAVLIYPLNALVNDQLDRLRVLLRNTNITFGRYTSELESTAERARKQMEKEWQEMEPARRELFDQYPLPNEIIGRDQIREQGRLPQILITNYAMLEYLLLRPQDSPLFNQGKWRFVVLDEAHTYAGAQGIEVGMLMRRLKQRLGHQPGQMRCIATSATLTNDDAKDASQFAEALFGETFTPDDIIFGEPNHDYIPPAKPRQPPVEAYLHPQFDSLIQNVRQEQWESTDEMALLMQEIGLITEDELSLADTHTPSQFLWRVLQGNSELAHLRQIMADRGQPVEVTAIAETLFHNRMPLERHAEALYHLIELAAMAREDVEKPSLLPARYHLFVRPPQGIWVCLNPQCSHRTGDTEWSKLFATPRETCDECGMPVYPVVVCRTCGQVYVRMKKVGKQFLADASDELEPHKHYFTWRAIHDNLALAEDDEDEDNLVQEANESLLRQVEMEFCLACQQEVKRNGCGCVHKSDRVATLYLLQTEKPERKGKTPPPEPVEHIKECGRCHSQALKGTEIATDITLNALTPLAVLTDDLYRELPPSAQPGVQEKPGRGRKLLSFYDSRQGAARFAAFVQDIVNQQAYRRLILEATKTTATPTFLPDLERISLKGLDLALRHRVAHNDMNIKERDLPRQANHLSQSQRQTLESYMRTQVMAEITTQLRSRQSLEALGLLSIQYFEPDQLPDFSDLASKLHLSVSETKILVEYLLDDLRRNKVVVLPEGVNRSDAIFGRNKFSPRLVRNAADVSKNEIAWIGQTTRHRRYQLLQKILAHKNLPHDETTIKQALSEILDWLIHGTDVLDTSRPSDGYQIRSDRLFFQANAQWYRCNHCQRLSCRGNLLPCPHPHCPGQLELLSSHELIGNSFYYDNLQLPLIPMRVEEHTAQLHPDKGRKYQNGFKSGDINMLSCSTTFEMGIDLGDLQAVVMSNIPPTVANYKQRAGRAGRRTSGTAFILAWASNRPHDQAYFKAPAEIISGQVRVPYLDVQNPVILQRHINAILLSEFLRYSTVQGYSQDHVGAFFDEQTPGGATFALLPPWLLDKHAELLSKLDRYIAAIQPGFDPQQAVEQFLQDMREKGHDHYQHDAGYYKMTWQELYQKQGELFSQGTAHRELKSLQEELKRVSDQLERLRQEDIINYLSDRGVLPSYSFPLHTVELRIPPQLLSDKQLRLQRNLREAIREYAPSQEVVADKRIWRSEGLNLLGKEPRVFAYLICPTCNHLRLEETAGKGLADMDQPCPVCKAIPTKGRWSQKQYIQPDGFRVSSDSGQPAGQYVDRPYNRMRSALVPRQVYTQQIGNVLAIGYDRDGALLYVNEGPLGGGFRICSRCGKQVPKRLSQCDGKLNGLPCLGRPERNGNYTLGFMQKTDTLHIKFSSAIHIPLPDANDQGFWLSLQYALLFGASRALQLERKDIDGVLFPDKGDKAWQQTIVLYDNVPGGAGYVKRIEDEIERVVAAALEIVDCDCEKSCYRCLQEYGNQWEHHLLERGRVAKFLRALDADLQSHKHRSLSDVYPVAAVNQIAWLWEQVKQTRHSLILAADKTTLNLPTTDGLTWLDLLQQLMQRHVKVHLYLNELPTQNLGDTQAIAIATHLRLLLRKGLELRQTKRQIPWNAVIDTEAIAPLAIRAAVPFSLSDEFSGQFLMTKHGETVREAESIMDGYGRVIEYADLREPPEMRILEVRPDGHRHTEADYFAEFYARPVKRMVVSDRYLDTKEKILNRLGNHIVLAQQAGQLERVIVKTRDWGQDQKDGIKQIKARFPQLNFTFNLEYETAHDRTIELLRGDGSEARVIMGLGLDFINKDGLVQHTFLMFQDPFVR